MFITFEGLDGSGKTTQIHTLLEWLRQEQGRDVLHLREPGGTVIGDAVRHVLHDLKHDMMDARSELLLYNASRAQLVAERIQPHLRAGGVVICDRFADSTLAYQGYGRGLELAFLSELIGFATHGLKPDLTLYLAIDPQKGLERRMQGSGEWNRLDAEPLAFHKRVAQGYAALIAAEPSRWQVIAADRPIDIIAKDIRAAVTARLQTH